DGQRVGDAEILESALTKILEKAPAGTEKKVLFKCDKGTDQKYFLPVMRAISRAGAGLAALGEKEK
ncbi:MAG: hypothetical protein ACLFV7_13370, partial [Phycisphaerae bacterium]